MIIRILFLVSPNAFIQVPTRLQYQSIKSQGDTKLPPKQCEVFLGGKWAAKTVFKWSNWVIAEAKFLQFRLDSSGSLNLCDGHAADTAFDVYKLPLDNT